MDYKSKRWEDKSKRILRRDKYTCQYFKRYGKMVEANIVHHLIPVETHPEYAFCDWNLISLSAKAHNIMHDRDGHKLTAEGEAFSALMLKKHPPCSIDN